MTREDDASTRGVRDAWDYWLSQHPVSVPDLVKAAVARAFTQWLEGDGAEVIATAAREAHIDAHDEIGRLCVEISRLQRENEALRAQKTEEE